MAKNTTAPKGRQQTRRSDGDSAHWIVGLLLFFAGLLVTASLFFHFFCWEGDQSGLPLTGAERALRGIEAENPCGWWGAWLGHGLVDRSFGVCGIILPILLMLVGVRIIRQRSLLFNHSVLSLVLIMIFGSLTLGFLFGKWPVCSSTGLGGDYGIGAAEWLRTNLGPIGTLILLAGGWILIGVLINRNFIDKVNTAGNAMVGGSGRLVDLVRRKAASGHGHDEPDLPEEDRGPEGLSDSESPAAEPAQSPGESQRSRPAEPAPRPADEPAPEENPFLEIPVQQEAPAEIVREKPHEEPAASADEEFIELDLSQFDRPERPEGRVVMGKGGLVELEPSRGTSAPVQEGPFTEIVLPGAETAAPAAAAEAAAGPAGTPEIPEIPADSIVELELRPESSLPADRTEPRTDGTPVRPQPEGAVVTVEEHEARVVDVAHISTEAYDPLKDLVNYRKPPVTLLEDYPADSEVSDEEIYDNKSRIEQTLKDFGIPIQRIKATVGPTVTLYEIVQGQGVKISKIQGLENDIAQSLKALGIRIIAPIPGKGTIGIEVPNRSKQVVSMFSAVRSLRFQESRAELPVVIGRTIQNENYVFDLAKMPHLLVAGATGQGKSVGLNAIITSLLYRKHPAQLKFVMIDPKMVEFSLYAKIERHFLAKMESEEEAIITDPRKAVYTLNALCIEMENRLSLCKDAGARNIKEYNEKFTARRLNPQKGHRFLPYIVVVVDEFADLIMTAREVEAPVMRLAQKARAVGIHLIIATQRPDVKVITGGIKANFPARIAFRVMQMIDSRTIIDRPGAEQLIGRGDMLFSNNGELIRIQCALVDTPEVERIVDYIAHEQGYTAPYPLPDYTPEGGEGGSLGSEESSAPVKYDSLFAEIAREAVSSGNISTSMIQRNYEVGFNRAGRIMMQLERAGIVGRQQGAKPRDILFHDPQSLEAKLQELGVF